MEDSDEADVFEGIVLADWPEHPFLIAKSDQVIRRQVRATGQWERELARFAAGLLLPGSRVVVGGGHIGLLAFQIWRERPDAEEIVVFEPDPLNAALLSLNVASWGPSPIRTMPIALSDRGGTLCLARNPVNSGDNRLWTTIPADLSAGGGDPELWNRQQIIAVALDDIWGDVPLDLLLLDTQGWEPEALKGAEHVLAAKRPVVIFEWWPRGLIERRVDLAAFLSWLENDLGMELNVVPLDGWSTWSQATHEAVADGDIGRITASLLADPDPTAYVELVARPTR